MGVNIWTFEDESGVKLEHRDTARCPTQDWTDIDTNTNRTCNLPVKHFISIFLITFRRDRSRRFTPAMQTVIKRHLSFVRVQRLRSSVQFSFFLFFNFIIAAAADSATVLPLFRDLKAAWGTRNVYSRATFQNNLIFYPRLLAFLNKKKNMLIPPQRRYNYNITHRLLQDPCSARNPTCNLSADRTRWKLWGKYVTWFPREGY